MKNIFENAKFGDKFQTKDGRMAVLVNWGDMMQHVFLYVKERDIEFYGEEMYNLDGTTSSGSTSHDIVSRWAEPIDSNYLLNLSCANYPCDGETDAKSFHKGFKAGYQAAKQK